MPSVISTEVIHASPAAAVQRTYLNCADLLLRHTWTVSALAYSYSLEPVRLRPAVQKLAEAYPTLTGRWVVSPDAKKSRQQQFGCFRAEREVFQMTKS